MSTVTVQAPRPGQPGGGSPDVLAQLYSAAVLAQLFCAADDDQWLVVREVALTAGLLWRCPCDWYNPQEAVQCEDCEGLRPRPRPGPGSRRSGPEGQASTPARTGTPAPADSG